MVTELVDMGIVSDFQRKGISSVLDMLILMCLQIIQVKMSFVIWEFGSGSQEEGRGLRSHSRVINTQIIIIRGCVGLLGRNVQSEKTAWARTQCTLTFTGHLKGNSPQRKQKEPLQRQMENQERCGMETKGKIVVGPWEWSAMSGAVVSSDKA